MSSTAAPFRRTLLALTIALAGQVGLAHAEPYQLPAGPLAATLNQIASQAGVTLSIDPALTEGKRSAPVEGDLQAVDALNQALRGTGLQLQSNGAGVYSLVPAAESAVALPDVTVTASEQAAETAWGPTRGYLASRTATGTKTDTPLLETPRSISVATREQMQDRKVQNLDDAVRYMPGVIASSYGSDSRADWMKIRGFEPIQLLDGLPLPKGSYTMPKLETWNLERVAVLRGPASSVYGQTPPGGLVDAVSRRPQAESSHEVQVQVGNYQHKQISFDSTGKIDDEGRFLYRFSGVGRDSGTVIEHMDDQRFNLAPSLTWNIAGDTRLTFLGQFNRDDTGGTSQFLPLQGTKLGTPAGKIDYNKNLGDPDWEFYDKTFYALGYAFEHRINDVWQFNQNLRYSKLELDNQIITAGGWATAVADDGTVARGANVYDENISHFAMDNNFQADFRTGALTHTLLLGVDYLRVNTDYRWLYGSAPSSNIINPIYGQDFSGVAYTAFQDYNQKRRNTGLYLQDQIALDAWRLTLGGRWDRLDTDSVFYNANDAKDSRRDSQFSGNAALSYVFDSGFTPYLSYAESFQAEAGGNGGAAFKPSTGKQYELGIKYQPPGSDMLFTAAVYDLKRQNIVTTNIAGASEPVSEVEVRGLELEATGNLTENLSLTASYTYTNSKMTKVGDPRDKNRALPLTPEHQASIWADYDWNQGMLAGFGVGFGARFVGSTDNIAVGNLGFVRDASDGHSSAYTVYDAAVRYDLGQLDASLRGASVSLNANNLFDKEYLATCDGFYCYAGDPRRVTASIDYKW
ncbi:TonB-dependent siderophore receptor [Ectopseudomonas hydrolytica]|uniref:TonB-dependent siderophore receptor n=1 Tax=Ectopseudomonas hydrolytica TaxID=2493633 RepID=UPI0018A72708|nr:TonB-dependent siderophore receptor [Pseudomonas hydrolytica]MBF8160524.1 TonB-dependent siderophore receptor [Pseudomonas mendocina]UTH33537.1 TonB-dependent siderophore receptor [Pseudomonas hydrolytica]UZZ12808.1 TonB-dependent siderophore receptor [Pseudomonas mendocina]